jgi:DNA-nicking Smr family endonuclease
VPIRFQLAAGMAIEVDGVLDLRGHTLQDAMDRLKDRLGDGQVLGWRSLQVILGGDPVLHDGLLALLASGQTPMVARYAQAPVPMGGSQAWLLYFTPSQPQS